MRPQTTPNRMAQAQTASTSRGILRGMRREFRRRRPLRRFATTPAPPKKELVSVAHLVPFAPRSPRFGGWHCTKESRTDQERQAVWRAARNRGRAWREAFAADKNP